jgi:hypothetical protein
VKNMPISDIAAPRELSRRERCVLWYLFTVSF